LAASACRRPQGPVCARDERDQLGGAPALTDDVETRALEQAGETFAQQHNRWAGSPIRLRSATAKRASAPRLTPNVTQPVTVDVNAWLTTTTTAPAIAIASAMLLMKR
jgi:hypothetical protein